MMFDDFANFADTFQSDAVKKRSYTNVTSLLSGGPAQQFDQAQLLESIVNPHRRPNRNVLI